MLQMLKRPSKGLTLAAFLLASSSIFASETLSVSDKDYNIFNFNKPVDQIIVGPNSPITAQPQFLAENKRVLLLFEKGNRSRAQLVVTFADGSVQTFYIRPAPIDGVSHDIYVEQENVESKTGNDSSPEAYNELVEYYTNVFKHAVAGNKDLENIGFSESGVPVEVEYNLFKAVPRAKYSNGDITLLSYRLEAKKGLKARVAAPQFYTKGVRAVLLDGDIVDSENTVSVFIITN